NYFDGTSWGAAPSTRVENVRTGFCNVAVTGTGAEFVVAHEAPTSGTGNGTHIASRTAKGTGTWTDGILGAADTWPRLVIGGPATNSIHIIAQTSGATTPVTPYHGQDGAISYSRSLDGGLTWDKIRTVIPQIDSSHYIGFGGDSYAMDIKGSTIAIVAGGEYVDVVLLKSTDNGTTWTKTIVNPFPIPMYNSTTTVSDTMPTDGIQDTIMTNDASLAVLIDNSGNAHVWFGRMRITSDGTSTGSSYFPYTDGLMYWNETMGSAKPVMIAGVQDLNGDGMMNIYIDPTNAVLGIGTFNRSLTSFPSAGIDAAGKIYLTYSSVFEGINDNGEGYDTGNHVLITPTGGKSFRHQYVMRSDDNGATWCTPHDITDPDGSSAYDYIEGVYGAMARDVDGFVHVIVQEDPSAGHGVSTTTTPDPQGGPANIKYFKIPVADLACNAGVQENAGTVTDMNLYPNPTDAGNAVNLVLNSSKSTKAIVKIYNVVGQEVDHFNNNLNTGINTFNVNVSNYKAGVYFVSTIVDGKNFTQKLIIK
ncbi:MAG: T9SS type A sorting domain-containing protein, partial [Bacteroidia bacterium]